jgi:hypothetical protein
MVQIAQKYTVGKKVGVGGLEGSRSGSKVEVREGLYKSEGTAPAQVEMWAVGFDFNHGPGF